MAVRNFTTPAELPDIDAIVEYSTLAETLGLDSVYVWDHILLGSRTPFPILDSLMTLAAVATHTKRVRLGTGALILPLRNPVVLAKQTATLDRLSNGRLTLGVAAGWYQKEFDAVGVEHAHRGRVFVRNLEILYQLWTGQVINDSEPPYHFRNVIMLPRPIQEPRPKVLIGGYVEVVLKRAGRYSDGWLSYLYTADSFARSWDRVKQYATEAGRDPSGLTNVNQLPICVDDNFEAADRRIKKYLAANTDLPAWGECTFDSAVRGTPEQCAEQLARHIDAGVEHFVFLPADGGNEQLVAIATDVLPKLRSLAT